jgi:hypothetical protein
MHENYLLIAAAVVVGGLVLARKGAAASPTSGNRSPVDADAALVAAVGGLYTQTAAQQAATQAAVAATWADLNNTVFKTEPAFWA